MLNISLWLLQGMWFFTEELDKDEKVGGLCYIADCAWMYLHTQTLNVGAGTGGVKFL